jgi:hypothetical protein
LIVCNSGSNFHGNGGNLWKVPNAQACARRPTDNVIRRVFVGIGCLVTCRDDDLESSIDTKSHVRIKVYAFAIDLCLGKILGVNSTRKEQVQVVVLRLVISNWLKLASMPLFLIGTHTF